jgi:hypothetical protein
VLKVDKKALVVEKVSVVKKVFFIKARDPEPDSDIELNINALNPMGSAAACWRSSYSASRSGQFRSRRATQEQSSLGYPSHLTRYSRRRFWPLCARIRSTWYCSPALASSRSGGGRLFGCGLPGNLPGECT